MSANERQIGGGHYRKQKIQHWDYVAANDLDYFQGQITKYVSRWRDKNGIQDLEKALHFLQKYIEVEKAKAEATEEELYQSWREGFVSTSHETDEAVIRKTYMETH